MGDFTMPSLGADMEAGTLVEWKIKPGDTVKRGDIVAVVETQKGAIDVEIFEDGKVQSLLVDPGTRVPVGTVLARIQDGSPASTGVSRVAAPEPPAGPTPAGASLEPGAPRTLQSPGQTTGPDLRVPRRGERRRASPAARSAARELGVDLDHVPGTGPGEAVTRGDVEQAARKGGASVAGPRSSMRQAIAAAMSRSNREIPHYYLSTRIVLVRALDWLRHHNEPLKPGQRLLPLIVLLKAVAMAIRKAPEMNGFYQDGAFRPAEGIHLGIAISLRQGGLVVPALHDVDSKPLDVLGAEFTDLVQRSRSGQLRSSELADSTMTVTSLGERGVEEVFGVIFPPQVALVGFGKVVQAPVVVDGQCVARPIVHASLAADHRVSDGHRGGLFLAEVGTLLQDPERL